MDYSKNDIKYHNANAPPSLIMRIVIRNRLILPVLVLLACLIITYIDWNIAKTSSEKDLRSYLEYRIMDHNTRIERRLKNNVQILQNLRSLYNISDDFNRAKFRIFINSLDLAINYPGVQGEGFSLIISPEQKSKHINKIREEGFPGYNIWPDGKREIYTSIIYLEPFKDLNLRAFGYDMFTNPVRRKAMENARDSNKAVMSGKVYLVQETGKEVQAGFLIYLPVYRNNQPHTTILERRENIIGWFYTPFRMNDFVGGLFGYRANDLNIQIYDGINISNESELFKSNIQINKSDNPFSLKKQIEFNGHRWTIIEKSTQALEARIGNKNAGIILIVGFGLSLLLALTTWLLLNKWKQNYKTNTERKIAEDKLIASELQYRRLFESAKDGILILNSETGKIIDVNPFLIQLLGYSKEEFLEKNIWEIGFLKNFVANKNKFLELKQKKYVRYENLPLETIEGRKINVEFVSNVYSVNSHKVIQCNIRDITERKRAEEQIHRLDRVYKVLSGVNKMIVRVKNLEDLFNDTCNIVVKLGYYDMVWIGWIDEKSNTVKPVAWDGNIDEYLEDLKISLDNKSGNIGTAGSAILENHYIVNNDIEFDKSIGNMGMKALKKGLQSVASFPLGNNEKISAVISFYSQHKNHFSDDEIMLLEELAEDVSFSIYSIEQQKMREQAEDALRNNEARLHTLVRTIPDLIWLKNTNGVYLSCNPMFERFFGAKEADIIGKTDYDFVDRELAESFREHDQKAMEAGKPTSNEEWLTFADDGHEIFSETIKTPMYDSTGKLIGILGIGRDITDRKRAEETLRASEERFKTIFEQSPLGIALIDSLTGKIYEANKRFAEIAGRTVEEIPNIDWMQITHPDDLQADLDNMTLMNAGNINGYHMEKRYLYPDGTVVWINMTIAHLKGKDKSNPLHLCMIEDITGRKKAEESLLKLSMAVEQSPVSVIITNPSGDIEYVNDKFCGVTGYSKEDVTGKNPNILKSGLQDSNYYEDLWNTILSGKEWKGEIQNKKKNGGLYWESVLISPLINEHGDITHFIAVKEDITEQKNIRSQLLISEERYKAIFNTSLELIYIFDLQGNLIDTNQHTLDLFEYTYEEACRLSIFDLLSPADLPIARENIEYVLANGTNKGLQVYKFSTKRGKGIFVETTAVRLDRGGKPYAILGIARDITLNKLAEDALKESEKKYRDLFEKMLDGVYKSTHDGKFIQVNDAMVKMLGYNNKQELYDLNIKTQLYFQDGDRESAALEERYEEMAIFRLKKKDGSETWVEDHGRHVLDEKGNILYHEGVMRDVSERLKIEAELIQAKEKAEEMNRLKTNFLANMSHELRTPLIGILGYAEFLENELKDKDLLQMAITIKNSGKRLNTTLNNILDLSRLDSRKQQVNLKKQDIIKYLIEQTGLFKIAADGKGIALKLEIKEKILDAFIDEEMFVSIISNLLSNAIKFTKEGCVTLRAMRRDDKVVIEIEDQGIGIPGDYLEIIFEPFRQASEGFSRGYEGTGLGLTIVKKYTDLIGGTISVKSRVGDPSAGIAGGSTFTLILPVNKNDGSKSVITRRG